MREQVGSKTVIRYYHKDTMSGVRGEGRGRGEPPACPFFKAIRHQPNVKSSQRIVLVVCDILIYNDGSTDDLAKVTTMNIPLFDYRCGGQMQKNCSANLSAT